MCFSAEASFAGAAVLGICGYVTLKISPKQTLLLALTPLLFALQQACEGIIWLDLRNELTHSALTIGAKNLYLFFALGFWPTWLPLAIFLAEKEPINRRILLFIFLAGIVVSFINIASYSFETLTPYVQGNSIQYLLEAPFYKKIWYLGVIVAATFFSSLKKLWVFGVLSCISFFVTQYAYTKTFTSVWCFMSALLSITLYAIIRANLPQPASEIIKK